MDRSEELAAIRGRLSRARRRVEGATRGGPEWDAAMDELEELEARFGALLDDGRGPTPSTTGRPRLEALA